MKQILKNIIAKVIKVIKYIFIILFFIISAGLVELMIKDIFNIPDSYVSYHDFKNGYYKETIVDKDVLKSETLKNKKDNYVYADNFPKENIIGYIETGDILLLKCVKNLEERHNTEENNLIFYKINTSNDQIIGPLNKKDFLQEINSDLNIEMLKLF